MQEHLPLEPLVALLPKDRPFTPLMARQVGVPRSALDRLVRHGVVRRVRKGVYADATLADDVTTRARALALVVPRGKVVHARSAAWLYGVRVSSGRGLLETTEPRPLSGSDWQELEGVAVTTPTRTALDLARTLNPDRGIATLDAFLRAGLVQHLDLLAELPRFAGHAGVRQLRELVARADGRSGSEAESVLRLRWLEARLPTPTPRLGLGQSWVELALPLRRFGAVLAHRLTPGDLAWARMHGWALVELSAPRVLGSDPALVSGHLEREFHRHLLSQAG